MKIIDVHTHVFPDRIARQTIETLYDDSLHLAYWGSREGLIESMNAHGIDMSVTLPVATKPSQVTTVNDFAASHPRDRIIPLGSVHPHCKDVDEVLRQFPGMGLYGVKLHADYQEVGPEDSCMEAIYEACEAYGLILFLHMGLDFAPQSKLCNPRTIVSVLENHPDITYVLAHMGGYKEWEASEELLVGRDVYFDTSSCFGHMSSEQFERMVKKHGIDKVMFGTDGPWEIPKRDIDFINACDFTEEERAKIFYKNAEKLFGVTA